MPEITLHLADEALGLWQATEETLAREGLPPPYWAFAWPGGQAIARHVLDHRELVAGRAVLDFAAGSGLAAIAAAMMGAARVVANEIDGFAEAAIRLNAEANRVAVEVLSADLLDSALPGFEVILAGDVCYERPMAERATRWLRAQAAAGALVLLGDPGRAYRPTDGLIELAQYAVPTPLALEDRTVRDTVVWRVV